LEMRAIVLSLFSALQLDFFRNQAGKPEAKGMVFSLHRRQAEEDEEYHPGNINRTRRLPTRGCNLRANILPSQGQSPDGKGYGILFPPGERKPSPPRSHSSGTMSSQRPDQHPSMAGKFAACAGFIQWRAMGKSQMPFMETRYRPGPIPHPSTRCHLSRWKEKFIYEYNHDSIQENDRLLFLSSSAFFP
jgi:hypothetical protein